MRDRTHDVSNHKEDPVSPRQAERHAKQDPVLQLERAKPTLFSQTTTKIQLQTVAITKGKTPSGVIATDLVLRDRDFDGYFQKHINLGGNTFIYLFQDHSWAPLNLSARALRLILATIKAPEELLRLLYGFGHPNESFGTDFPGGFGSYLAAKDKGLEAQSNTMSQNDAIDTHAAFAYTLRYVAKTGRPISPWSERKMGVYQELRHSTSLWVILQPTTAALDLPLSGRNAFQSPQDQLNLHLLLLSSSLPPWREYLQHLDGLVKAKSREARKPAQKPQREFAFSAVQDLQYYSELLHNAVTQLQSNKETLVGLQSISAACRGADDLRMQHQALACISQLRINLKWANGMLERIRQISNLVNPVSWPFHCAPRLTSLPQMTMLFHIKHRETLTLNTTKLTQLTEVSQKDQDTMLGVAMAAKKDSEVMKVIAIASLISLPCTLVTSLFSTGFVTSSLSPGAPDNQSRVTNQALIYTFATLCLTILVSAVLYLWDQRNQLRR
ncbi:hypothetical protein NCS52_00591700 [Fusarium sp. LHS14.1]|nr:hypothetical protein NCS52_00591700 [Fusarium sp. LHS14.1]